MLDGSRLPWAAFGLMNPSRVVARSLLTFAVCSSCASPALPPPQTSSRQTETPAASSAAAPSRPASDPASAKPEPPAEYPGCGAARPGPAATEPVQQAVAAADRSPEDRALDAGRKPEQLLTFFGVHPGQRVAELGAGGGYTAELLARVVGPSGRVFGQNSQFLLERFAEKPWSERLRKPVMQNVVRVDRAFDDPLPPDAAPLDAVLNVLFYHDTVWQGVDRDAMNQAVFRALRSGGIYGIVDHSARPNDGLTQTETLHRIEERLVIEEVERAGFRLVDQAYFFKNCADARDWNASPRVAGDQRGTSDRFVLKFIKP